MSTKMSIKNWKGRRRSGKFPISPERANVKFNKIQNIKNEKKLMLTTEYKDILTSSPSGTTIISNKNGSSLLRRQWYFVIPLAIIAYVIIVLVVEESRLCHGYKHKSTPQQDPFADWVYGFLVLSAICFGASLLCNMHDFLWDCGSFQPVVMTDMRCAIAVASVIPFLALISTTTNLATYYHGDNICMDGLGVETFAMQWPEWLVCVPLLLYIVIAVEDKFRLTRRDLMLLASTTAMIVFGMVLIVTPSTTTAWIVFIIASTMLIANVYLVLESSQKVLQARQTYNRTPTTPSVAHWPYSEDLSASVRLTLTTNKLSSFLLVVFPLSPLAYVLSATRAIDRDVFICTITALSLGVKVVFMRWLMRFAEVDITPSYPYPLLAELHQERLLVVNAAKRSHLASACHELRVPLNTLNMGISVVGQDPHSQLSQTARDAMQMMTGASNFIADTLNTVLNINKIEEGAVDLSYAPFRLNDLVINVGRCGEVSWRRRVSGWWWRVGMVPCRVR